MNFLREKFLIIRSRERSSGSSRDKEDRLWLRNFFEVAEEGIGGGNKGLENKHVDFHQVLFFFLRG